MKPKPEKSSLEIFQEGTLVDEALNQAFQEMLLRHKKLGQPIVVWENGKVVVIPPEEIQVDEPPLE